MTGLYESARTGTPIVIVAESGGCATDIYNFVIKGIALPDKYGDALKRGSGAYQIAEVQRLHTEEHSGRLLSFFSLERGDTDLAHAARAKHTPAFGSAPRFSVRTTLAALGGLACHCREKGPRHWSPSRHLGCSSSL